MAKVTFSRKEFEKHIKLTKEIEEQISLFGTHFEEANDESIILEIMPNRPDLYSLPMFLKAFQTFLGRKANRKYNIKKPEKDYLVKIAPSVREVRPYTACAIVKNLNFDDEKIKEIIDIQEKIHNTLGRNRKKIAIGIYPLEKITLPIKLEARKPQDIRFIPLEFDRELNALQILSQHPTGRDYGRLLEGKDKFPIFVDAKNKILSMPPIINSHETGKITQDTTSIFIECSGFDLEILKKTLNILVTILMEMNGEVYQMKVGDYLTPDLSPIKTKISLEDCNKLLGLELNEVEMKKLLEKMGHNYNNGVAESPAYRTNLMHAHDVYTDIAIAYGINNFIPEIPSISTIGEIDKNENRKKKISEILTGLDFLETSSYHLLTKEDANEKCIEVLDSKSDYKFLRNDLLSSSFKILKENVDNEYPQKIFEIGAVFQKDDREETGIKESEKLSICSTPSNFTELKQILEYLGNMLSTKFNLTEAKDSRFIEGRTAKIIMNEKEIGILGEVHPELLKKLHLKLPLACLELDLEEIYNNLS